MPLGTHHSIAGRLMMDGSRIVLEADSGGIWELDADRPVGKLLGKRVRVQGIRSGFNLLDVECIKRGSEF